MSNINGSEELADWERELLVLEGVCDVSDDFETEDAEQAEIDWQERNRARMETRRTRRLQQLEMDRERLEKTLAVEREQWEFEVDGIQYVTPHNLRVVRDIYASAVGNHGEDTGVSCSRPMFTLPPEDVHDLVHEVIEHYNIWTDAMPLDMEITYWYCFYNGEYERYSLVEPDFKETQQWQSHTTTIQNLMNNFTSHAGSWRPNDAEYYSLGGYGSDLQMKDNWPHIVKSVEPMMEWNPDYVF